MDKLKILFLEDISTDVELAQREIRREEINFVARVVDTEEDFRTTLEDFQPDLIISDYSMPSFDGMSALKIVRTQFPSLPFIILTGSMNEETAVGCMKAGADDYVLKGKIKRLPFAVQEVLKKNQAKKEKFRAERALKESEEKFRTLFESMAAGSCLDEIVYKNGKAVDYRILDVNPSYERMMGISREKAKGSLGSKVYGLNKAPFLDVLAKVAETGEPERFEAFFEPIQKYLDFTVSSTAKGMFSTVFSDITERKQMEEALRASELQKEIILNTTQEMFAFYDLDLKIIWANKASSNSVGLTPKEIIGKHCYEVWQNRKNPCKECLVLKAKNTKKHQSGETVTPDGKHWSIRAYPVLDKKGNVINLVELGMDITIQKIADEKVKLSEERLRNAEKIGRMGHVDWIVAEQRSYWSDEVFRIYERNPQLGVPNYQEIMALHKPEDAKRLEKAVVAALEKGIEYDLDLIAVMPSGEQKCLHVIGKPVQDANGLITNIKGTVQDITDRKRAEEALKEQQSLLTAIYRNAPLVLMVVDSERRIQQVNGFASQFADREVEEMLGLRGGEALRCLHALDDPKGCGFGEFCEQCVIRNTVLDTLETGETHLQIEAPYYFKKNEAEFREMTLLASTTPILVKDKQMALVTLQDITQRKQAENALKQSEARKRSYFENSPYGIFIVDNQGKYMEVNPKACKLTGYSESELTSMSISDLLNVENKSAGIVHFEKLQKNGYAYGELPYQKKDGSLRYWSVAATKISENLLLAFCDDITDRKIAEERIKQNLQEKELLLKEIYHRTKNNMQVVASLLKIQARQIGDERLQIAYREVINKINSMALVHQKLYETKDLSRINLNDYIYEVARLLRRNYGKTEEEIKLVYEMEDIFVTIDSAIPLSLVLTELLSNVLKHAFPDGVSGAILIRLYKRDEEITVLELADNGIGLSEDCNLRNLDSMGMQTVFNLVEYQLKGSIQYESKQGLNWKIRFRNKKEVRV